MMLTVKQAAIEAEAVLKEADVDPVVWHNVALNAEVAYVLLQSKRPAMQALGQQVRDAMNAYFAERG